MRRRKPTRRPMPRPSSPAAALLATAVLASLTGCIRGPDPIEVDESPVHVHAVLVAGADTATVMVSRPGETELTFGYVMTPVTGADVRLILDDDTTYLVPRSAGACLVFGRTPIGDGDGCYDAAFAAPVEPGQEWELDVRLPDGARVTGRTTVPAPPAINSPEPGTEVMVQCFPSYDCRPSFTDQPPYLIPIGTIPLAWTKPAGVSNVRVGLNVSDVAGAPANSTCQVEPEPLFDPFRTRRDTLPYHLYGVTCLVPDSYVVQPWDSVYVDMVITAVDDAYAEYERAIFTGGAARIDAVTAGIEGALGVFGAMATARRDVVLVYSEKPLSGPTGG